MACATVIRNEQLQKSGIVRLFAAEPRVESSRPAKAHLPVMIARGANGELQLGLVEGHVLRRFEFECKIPFFSRELELSGDHIHFGKWLCVHFLTRVR